MDERRFVLAAGCHMGQGCRMMTADHERAPDLNIRPITAADLPALRGLIDATGLFPGELLDGMTSACLAGATDGEIWLTVDDGGPVAVGYCAPERMTQGTWNMLLIAVHPERQRHGIGAALMRHVEALLRHQGARVLLVETSGLPAFARTRAFYQRLGYAEEARIREFYQAGEDKVIFRKVLMLGAM